MLEPADAIKMIQDVLSELHEAGLTRHPVQVTQETVLLGAGSQLDSLEFVTLISELEECVLRATGEDQPLVLTEILEFKTETASLDAGTVARFMARQAVGAS